MVLRIGGGSPAPPTTAGEPPQQARSRLAGDPRSEDRRYKGATDWGRVFAERRFIARALEGLYGLGLDGVNLADSDGGEVEVFAASW
jgi:hypothetical protein